VTFLDELGDELAALGFALQEVGSSFVFGRTALGSEVRVTVEPAQAEQWRVSVAWRQPMVGRAAHDFVPLHLTDLGGRPDDSSITLSRDALLSDLPALLERAILPMVDLAPS
jgi:hypothetical protein